MKKLNGKIILVDNDKYEKDVLKAALKNKNWEVNIEYFMNPRLALEYFKTTKDEIFLIISEMNMTEMTGMQLKQALDNDVLLRYNTIPFIFASMSSSKVDILTAYVYRVQGYFEKPVTTEEQANMIDIIIKYWIVCKHPIESETKETSDNVLNP